MPPKAMVAQESAMHCRTDRAHLVDVGPPFRKKVELPAHLRAGPLLQSASVCVEALMARSDGPRYYGLKPSLELLLAQLHELATSVARSTYRERNSADQVFGWSMSAVVENLDTAHSMIRASSPRHQSIRQTCRDAMQILQAFHTLGCDLALVQPGRARAPAGYRRKLEGVTVPGGRQAGLGPNDCWQDEDETTPDGRDEYCPITPRQLRIGPQLFLAGVRLEALRAATAGGPYRELEPFVDDLLSQVLQHVADDACMLGRPGIGTDEALGLLLLELSRNLVSLRDCFGRGTMFEERASAAYRRAIDILRSFERLRYSSDRVDAVAAA